MEEYKFIHLDQEHQQKIKYNNEKFEKIITKMEKERLVNQGDIDTLADEKKKLISELSFFPPFPLANDVTASRLPHLVQR